VRLRSIVGLLSLRMRGPLYLGLSLPRRRAGAVTLDVDHHRQDPCQCVPTCGAIALAYYGERVSPARIRTLGAAADSRYSGMNFDELVRGTTALGYAWFTSFYPVTRSGFATGLCDIVRSLRQRRPVVVSIDTPPSGHAVLVHGYDAERRVVCYTDPDICFPGSVTMPWDDFARRWQSIGANARWVVFTAPARKLSPRSECTPDQRTCGVAIFAGTRGIHPEVFELRRAVATELAEHGFEWPADYGAIDLWADGDRVEVVGIRNEEIATGIRRVLHRLLPHWSYPITGCAGPECTEPGSWVAFARHPADIARGQRGSRQAR
jgi:Peptidase_C39 like family